LRGAFGFVNAGGGCGDFDLLPEGVECYLVVLWIYSSECRPSRLVVCPPWLLTPSRRSGAIIPPRAEAISNGAATSKKNQNTGCRHRREETMGDISGPLAYLLLSWGLITVALVLLLVYRATLSSKEDDQLYLNKAEISMMGSDQAAVITRLHRLAKPIVALAILSGILLVASASLWVWIGLSNP
jgi:hypothetical protein